MFVPLLRLIQPDEYARPVYRDGPAGQIFALLQTKHLSSQQITGAPFGVKTNTYGTVVDLQSGSVINVLVGNPQLLFFLGRLSLTING